MVLAGAKRTRTRTANTRDRSLSSDKALEVTLFSNDNLSAPTAPVRHGSSLWQVIVIQYILMWGALLYLS